MSIPRRLRRLVRSTPRVSSKRRRHECRDPAAAIELLEDRTLLSAIGLGRQLTPAAALAPAVATTPVAIPPFVDPDQFVSQAPVVASAPPFSLADTFQLHSNQGATKVIYLDFDGNVTTNSQWNSSNNGNPIVTPDFSLDGDLQNFSNTELERIQKIWQRVAEDFIPFDVDVTTEDPGVPALRNTGGSDNEWGARICIGGSWTDWYESEAGGVSYVNVFDSPGVLPSFVFENNTANGGEKSTAEAISHETGHSLGLFHDGTSTLAYYSGHGSGATGWAPIMGVGYGEALVQWSQGEYNDANNTEDDLQIITGQNGFGYRTDDHGDTDATATAATQTGNSLSAAGIIEQNNDVDVFSFTSAGGQLDLDVLPFENSPNLDILAELYDAAGSLVASSNPLGSLNASFNLMVSAGQYFLRIDGTGKGDPLGTGYTDYGSLGSYTVTGATGSRMVFDSTDVPKTVPDIGTTTSMLTISDDVVIEDINVGLDISCIFDNSLDVFLIGPDGTRVELFTDVGGFSGSDFRDTVLDDEAPSITGESAPFTGTFAPEGSLADFDGRLAQGTWTLELTDDGSGFLAGASGWTLNSWSLSILPRAIEAGVTVTQTGGSTDVTEAGATDTYSVVLDAQPPADVTITLDPDTQLAINGAAAGAAATLTFTTANWDTAQTVTVAAVDDAPYEGSHTGTIVQTVSSSDTDYDGLLLADVTVNIADDDPVPNVAPSVTMTALALDYTEGDGAVVIDAGLTVADADDATLSGATVQIIGNYQNGEDLLSFTDQFGITASWDADTGTLTLSGSASVANYQTALRSVSYRNTSDDPNTSERTVSVRATDGTTESNLATRDITLVATNDAPVAASDSYEVAENGVLATGELLAGEPLLHYDFDEASNGDTDALDSGATPATSGTFVSIASRTGNTPGHGSLGALDLTGPVSGYVTAGDLDEIDALTEMTLTFWINFQADPHLGDWIIRNRSADTLGPAGSRGWSVTIYDGSESPFSASDFGLNFSVYESSGSTGSGSGKIMDGYDADDQWAFAAITFDRQMQSGDPHGIVSFWQGGTDAAVVQQGTSWTIDNPLIGAFNDGPFQIGGEGNPPVWIDDVRIYDHPLAQQELDVVRRQGVAERVLANDSDADGDPLTAALLSGPAHGTLDFNADGSFTYTPDADYSGSDGFTYSVSDGNGGTDVGTVTITVNAVNNAPVAVNDSYTIAEDGTLATSVVADQSSTPHDFIFNVGYDDQSLQQQVTAGMSGVLQSVDLYIYESTYNDQVGGSFSVFINRGAPWQTDAHDFSQVVTLTEDMIGGWITIDVSSAGITLSEGEVFSIGVEGTPGQKYATITAANDQQYAGGALWRSGNPISNGTWDLTFRTRMSTGSSIPGVLVNDSDPDGDSLSAELLTGPAHGTLTLGSNGGFVYQPDANYVGSDSFSYRASDGRGGMDIGTVSITINAVNDAPVVTDDSKTTEHGTPLIIDVVANDSDPDGDSLTVTGASDPPRGTATINPDGTITYTPDNNFSGPDSFTYTVSDGNGGSDTATVWMTVEELTVLSLTVTVTPSSFDETDGFSAATGTVTRSGDLSEAVVVALTSSDPSEAAVPATVTIPAGEASGTFGIDAVDDDLVDGTQTVVITATVPTSPGHGAVQLVLDDAFNFDGTVDPLGGTKDVALGPNGKIVVVGYQQINDPQNPENHRDLIITRYTSDGSLDSTFGGDGRVTADITGEIDWPHAVAVQDDGKILVGGHVYNGPDRDWLLVRYNVDGSLDTTFGGGDGIVITDTGTGSDHIYDLLVQPDGKIVVAGDVKSSDIYDGFAVARYNGNGTLDTSFSEDGIATTDFFNRSAGAYAVARQDDGKIVVAGTVGGGNFDSEFALVRFNTDGTRDSSFGGDGRVTVNVPGDYEGAFDLVIQPDGRIVVVGQVGKAGTYPPNYETALTRLNPDGALDTSFGGDGFVVSDIGNYDAANGVALTDDGRILIAGPGLALYGSDGTLLASDTSLPSGQDLVVQPDGSILIVGPTVLKRYRVTQSISDTATLQVLDVLENDPPFARSDQVTATQDTPITIDVLANDFDDDPLTITSVDDPIGGTATITDNGTTVTFTPEAGFAGSTDFHYTVSDGRGGTDSALVRVSIYGTAVISGTVWEDLDGDGTRDPGEGGLGNRTVYLDLNHNGALDSTSQVTLDPDDLPSGVDVSNVLPQATLSAIDGTGQIVAGVYASGSRGFPADMIFAHSSGFGAEDILWRFGFREMRIDFHVPVRSVSIDSTAPGRLEIYDAAGTLLGTTTSNGNFDTMTITATTDIAYAIAAGDANSNSHLDNLRFTTTSPEPVATSDAQGNYSFTDLLPGEYVVREVLPDGFEQTVANDDNGYFYGQYRTRIYKVDALTGDFWLIGPQDGQTAMQGMAYTNSGELFGMNGAGSAGRLYQIDPETGVATLIGPAGLDLGYGLAYDGATDTLYGISRDIAAGTTGLVVLNRATGQATPVGPPVAGIRATSGLAFDAENDRVIVYNNADDVFWAFDPQTGAATQLGSLYSLAAYGFTETATELIMHRVSDQPQGKELVRVDPDNGTYSHFLTLEDAVPYFGALEYVVGDPFAYHVEVNPGETASAIDFGNQNPNDAPIFASTSYDFSVAENSAAGTTVGTADATDVDDTSLTFSIISGNTSNAFTINSTTGQITVANAAPLDFDTTANFNLTIEVSDGAASDTATVNIALSDIVAPRVTDIDFGYGTSKWADSDDLNGRTAPWEIKQIRIQFSRDVAIDQSDLVVTGTTGTYTFSEFTYNSSTFTAVWTLATPIRQDSVTFALDGDGSSGDGNDGVNTSGEYLEGGDWAELLDVLLGDFDNSGRVDFNDMYAVYQGIGGTYDPYLDTNGDGRIDFNDMYLVYQSIGNNLT